jgi:O-methyltransferase
VLSLVGRRQRVLVLGDAGGELSRALREQRDCEVVAVDDPAVADLGDRHVDVIVAVDVLQHLVDPGAVLARLAPVLAPGGYLVASVPNVAHGSVRLALLGGSFPYADDGLLDRTARRFFTRAALEETCRAGGFTVTHLETLDLDIDRSEVPFSVGPPTGEFVQALRDQADARAYRFVAVAHPDRAVAPLPAPARDGQATGASGPVPPPAELFDGPQLLYLDLLKRVLARAGFPERQLPARLPVDGVDPETRAGIAHWLDASNLGVVHRTPPTEWPVDAETMLTMPRLDSLVSCVGTVVRDDVPGDLIETGVWRGGACILMRAALAALGDRARTVWVADSFQGLPKPDADRYPADDGDLFWTLDALAVSLGEVMANFERYGLLDEQVRFLPGWFADTLPTAPIERLAVLRLDGDMYGSTMQALEALYPRLSVGGFAIVDDFGAVPGCRAAVGDYRAAHGITEPLVHTDSTEVRWRKER